MQMERIAEKKEERNKQRKLDIITTTFSILELTSKYRYFAWPNRNIRSSRVRKGGKETDGNRIGEMENRRRGRNQVMLEFEPRK